MGFSLNCTVTASLRRFSSCDGKVSAEYDCDDSRFNSLFKVTLHANGSCPQNGGHVSIIFNLVHYNEYIEQSPKSTTFCCVASVIDASGHKRFPQTFAAQHHTRSDERMFFSESFGFERFVKRSTLLSDPSELLPNDTLSICLEIDSESTGSFSGIYSKYDTDGLHDENGIWYLRMDTEFARDLCEMSSVFRDMMEFTTPESGTDRVSIPPQEIQSFALIFSFLSEAKCCARISDLSDLYVIADKYDMPQIAQLCHKLLIVAMQAITTEEILGYVEEDMRMISELSETVIKEESVINIFSHLNVGLESSTFSRVESEYGNKGSPQPFVLHQDIRAKENKYFIKRFGFEKNIGESCLWSDSSEDDDSFAIYLEIDYESDSSVPLHLKYETSGLHEENDKWYLRMDTEFARDLCKMSSVFQDMMEFTKADSGIDRVPIPPHEFQSFEFIFKLLSKAELNVTLSGMCKLYRFADKYDMQEIEPLCDDIFLSVIRAVNTQERLDYVEENIHLFRELSSAFCHDESLSETLAIYSVIKEKIEGRIDGEFGDSSVSELETEWRCEHRVGRLFEFSKLKREYLKMDVLK